MNVFMIGVYLNNGYIDTSIVNAITCPRTATSRKLGMERIVEVQRQHPSESEI